jgi:hypothetical protein
MGPVNARKGDKIYVLLRCPIPIVLRPVGEHFSLVGECYVQGLMHGEAADDMDKGLFPLEKVILE